MPRKESNGLWSVWNRNKVRKRDSDPELLCVLTGTIDYFADKWNGEQVAETIDDMGFECKLITDQGLSLIKHFFKYYHRLECPAETNEEKKSPEKSPKKAKIPDGKVELQLNGVRYSKGVSTH